MPRDIRTVGNCPKCHAEHLTCRYNQFQTDQLQIDSWEHKCGECGYRETTAFRSDDPEELQPADAGSCPYCGRQGNQARGIGDGLS